MQTLLAANLGYLGKLTRLVAIVDLGQEREQRAAMMELRALRETINNSLSQMNEQADAVQFETGPRRARNLRDREQMQTMQPAMRTIFLLELALAQYRPGRAEDERRAALAQFQEAGACLLAAAAAHAGQSRSVPAALLDRVGRALARFEQAEQQGEPAVTLCREIAKALESLWRAQQPAPAERDLALATAS
jgi:hypothetical protein